jgi:diguanylate cyclase (GGDEF)-like protein
MASEIMDPQEFGKYLDPVREKYGPEIAERIYRLYESAFKMGTRDGLTGLYRNEFFDQNLYRELLRINGPSNERKGDVSIIFMDMDWFKPINDELGHRPAGDTVLAQFGNVIKQVLGRKTDAGYRMGGDEFSMILPQTDEEGAQKIIERLYIRCESRKAAYLRKYGKELPEGHAELIGKISFSAGTASRNRQTIEERFGKPIRNINDREFGILPAEMLKEADQNMYYNKRERKADR